MERMTLKEWLINEGLWIYAGTTCTKISHVFLDGGKAFVPFERMQEFFDKYANDILTGKALSVVERTSVVDRFRMFMDVDIKNQEGIPSDLPDRILDALPTALKSSSVVVCKKTSHVISGLHLVFDDVFVSSKEAIKYLGMTLSNLKASFPDSNLEWTKILDGSVYKNSGLRMIFSSKGPKGDPSPYVPWFVSKFIDGGVFKEVVEDASKNVADWLKRCSLFPDPRKVEILGSLENRVESLRESRESLRESQESRESLRENKEFERVRDPGIDSVIEHAFNRETSRTPYRGVDFKIFRISETVEKDRKFRENRGSREYQNKSPVILKLNSHYCYNVKREHKSNTVYLIVNREKVEQACYDPDCSKHRKVIAGFGNSLSKIFFHSKLTSI